jgi:bZIP transcription factor
MDGQVRNTMPSYDANLESGGVEPMEWLTTGLDRALAGASPDSSQAASPILIDAFEWNDFSPRAVTMPGTSEIDHPANVEYKILTLQQLHQQVPHHDAIPSNQKLQHMDQQERYQQDQRRALLASMHVAGVVPNEAMDSPPTSDLLFPENGELTPAMFLFETVGNAQRLSQVTAGISVPPLLASKKKRSRPPPKKSSKSSVLANRGVSSRDKKHRSSSETRHAVSSGADQTGISTTAQIRRQQEQFKQHQQLQDRQKQQEKLQLQHQQQIRMNSVAAAEIISSSGMTADEKRRQRAERNRWSAEKSRLRRKQYTDDLEREVTTLREANLKLKKKTLGLFETLQNVDKNVEDSIDNGNGFAADVPNGGAALKAAIFALDKVMQQCPTTFSETLHDRIDLAPSRNNSR